VITNFHCLASADVKWYVGQKKKLI
jgi:hypothetical protein